MSKITSRHEGNGASFKVSIIDMKTGTNALSGLAPDHLEQDTLVNNILGGIYSVLNDLFVFYNPTVNSYKRLR
jgi:glutamine synthetase